MLYVAKEYHMTWHVKLLTLNFMAAFYGWGLTNSMVQSYYEEAVVCHYISCVNLVMRWGMKWSLDPGKLTEPGERI